MAIRLMNMLTTNLILGFDSWFISEAEEKFEADDGYNPKIWMDANEPSMDRIDAKAGSMLTHISMMVAAASFMVSSGETSLIERIIVGLEITAYLFFALVCVRCLMYRDLVTDTQASAKGMERYRTELRREVIIRRNMINLSIRWVFLITFVFMLSVAVHLVL